MQTRGFRSQTQAENFEAAARLHRRGGPLSPACGARSKTGRTCTQVPISGSVRCLRHAGPDAARVHRQNQLAGLRTGRVSPPEFARAEARRARNRLVEGWKRNPSLPGQTIDLGPNEGRFQAALGALGVDPGTALPALADWLRWRFQRMQLDRSDDVAWTRAVLTNLPRRMADAERLMMWVRAGDLDRRTKAGRALKAALLAGGLEHAVARGLAVTPAPDVAPTGVGLSGSPVRPWKARAAGGRSNRSKPDAYKVKVVRVRKQAGPGRPRKVPDGPEAVVDLMAFAWTCGPEVRAMMGQCPDDPARMDLLRTLRDFQRDPNDPAARNRWIGLVMQLGKA